MDFLFFSITLHQEYFTYFTSHSGHIYERDLNTAHPNFNMLKIAFQTRYVNKYIAAKLQYKRQLNVGICKVEKPTYSVCTWSNKTMIQNFGICFFDIFRRPVWDETLTSLETNHLISLSFLTFAFQNSGQRMWEAVWKRQTFKYVTFQKRSIYRLRSGGKLTVCWKCSTLYCSCSSLHLLQKKAPAQIFNPSLTQDCLGWGRSWGWHWDKPREAKKCCQGSLTSMLAKNGLQFN